MKMTRLAQDRGVAPQGIAKYRGAADDLQRSRHVPTSSALRSDYKESFEKKHGVRLGFMGFFVKACVAALKDLPNVKCRNLKGDDIVYKNYYDIGIAVSTERGLIVPVLRDADKLSLAGIEAAINDFGVRGPATTG